MCNMCKDSANPHHTRHRAMHMIFLSVFIPLHRIFGVANVYKKWYNE